MAHNGNLKYLTKLAAGLRALPPQQSSRGHKDTKRIRSPDTRHPSPISDAGVAGPDRAELSGLEQKGHAVTNKSGSSTFKGAKMSITRSTRYRPHRRTAVTSHEQRTRLQTDGLGRKRRVSAASSRKLAKLALAAVVGAAILGPASAASATSVAQVGTSSVIAVQGPHPTLRFYWQTIGGVPWHPELVAPFGTTFA